MTDLTKSQSQQQYEGSRLAAAAYAASDIKILLSSNSGALELATGFHSALVKQGFTAWTTYKEFYPQRCS